MKKIYVLLIGSTPIATSTNRSLLEKRRLSEMEDFVIKMPSHGIQILEVTDDRISYHTGIRYETDLYHIEECESLD